MYGQPCQPAATFCSSAVGSQRPRQPSGVCPGTAGRLAQLHARSARNIARWGLSTRAGPRCLPRLGGRSIVYTLGANHCAAGGSQRPDGSWYQPFRSSPTHLIFQSVLPLRLRPVDYLSYRQTSAICSHAFLLKNGRYMMRKYKQGPNAPSPGRYWKQAEQNNHRSLHRCSAGRRYFFVHA